MLAYANINLLLARVILLFSGLLPDLNVLPDLQTVEVQTNRAQIQFPDQITFQLEIAASSSISTIELEYGVEKTSCGQTSGRIEPEITSELQGHQVQATWTWELYRSGSLPPGARVWWRWHITTEAGESQTTPHTWIIFNDDRHAWRTLTEGQITVYWYEGGQAFGQQILQIAVEAQARLTADPSANLKKPVHLYLYADTDDLRAALIFPQRWTGGVAFVDFYTVLIAADPQNQTYGQRIVAHELMHLVVHQLAFNCWGSLPRWLDEGLASWAEGDLEPARQEMLDEAIAEDRLFSLQSLSSGFSAHADRANLSYAQSQSVVTFMIDTYGREKILELLSVFQEGATYDGALEQVYGFDTDGLDDLWRVSVGLQPRPTTVASVASPSPMPTMSLWSEAPTSAAATTTAMPSPLPSPTPPATATATPSLSPRLSATSTPAPIPLVAAASPTAQATRASSFGPTPIGGLGGGTDPGDWTWYVVGSVGILVGLISLVLLVVRARQH